VLAALGGRLFDTGFCDRHAGVESHCLHTRDCSIRPVLRGLQQAIDQVLGELTLASLVGTEGEVVVTLRPRAIKLPIAQRAG
jgi:DNA-binding IscR family transcriptional regulator